MHHLKIWGVASGLGSIASLLGATLWAQINALDLTAAVGYVSGIGLAILALYAKYRDERRKQDMADRESRRHDCEEKLWVVQSQLNDLKQTVSDQRAELDRWHALWDGSRSPRQTEPPCKS